MGHTMDSGEIRQLNCHSFSKRTLTVKKVLYEKPRKIHIRKNSHFGKRIFGKILAFLRTSLYVLSYKEAKNKISKRRKKFEKFPEFSLQCRAYT